MCEMCWSRLAPTRLVPFSYFWTCWNVSPSASPRSVWLIASIIRRMRTRLPTCLSIGLLRELVPATGVIAVIANPNYPDVVFELKDLEEAARILGLQLHVANASSERELEAAFASFVQWRADALLVTTDPFLGSRRDQVLDLAARHALPSMHSSREEAA